MRIDEKIGKGGVGVRKGQQGASRTAGAGSPFAGKLAMTERDIADYHQEVEELKRQIDEAGDVLDKEPNMSNFKKFKALLTALTKKVTTEALRVEQVFGTPMNPQCYELVRIVDQKADELYQLVLSEHKDRIKITSAIMELRGLVVNFRL